MGTRKIDGPVMPGPVTKTSPIAPLPVFDEIPQQKAPVKILGPSLQVPTIGKGISLFVPGFLIFLAGIMYTSSSFSNARSFSDFSQQLVLGNVLVTVGVVMLYNAISIFGINIAHFIRNRGNL